MSPISQTLIAPDVKITAKITTSDDVIDDEYDRIMHMDYDYDYPVTDDFTGESSDDEFTVAIKQRRKEFE